MVSDRLVRVPDVGSPPFRVRSHPEVKRDIAASRLHERLEEIHWFLAQHRVLGYWPLDVVEEERFRTSLGLESFESKRETIYETEFEMAGTSDTMTVYFWMNKANRQAWVLHACDAGSLHIQAVSRRRAARRLRDLKGCGHDRSYGVSP